MTADQSELEWLRDWRTRLLSAMRLWFNATGYRDGCDRLKDLRAVLNEKPPHRNQGESLMNGENG